MEKTRTHKSLSVPTRKIYAKGHDNVKAFVRNLVTASRTDTDEMNAERLTYNSDLTKVSLHGERKNFISIKVIKLLRYMTIKGYLRINP